MRQIDTTSYENNIERRFSAFAANPCKTTGRAVSQSVIDWILAIAENINEASQILNDFHEAALREQNDEMGIQIINSLTDAVRRRLSEHYSHLFTNEGIFA